MSLSVASISFGVSRTHGYVSQTQLHGVAWLKKASVHMAQPSLGTPGLDWHEVELLLKKHLVDKGIPVYVYLDKLCSLSLSLSLSDGLIGGDIPFQNRRINLLLGVFLSLVIFLLTTLSNSAQRRSGPRRLPLPKRSRRKVAKWRRRKRRTLVATTRKTWRTTRPTASTAMRMQNSPSIVISRLAQLGNILLTA
jgi:hypothetical protein